MKKPKKVRAGKIRCPACDYRWFPDKTLYWRGLWVCLTCGQIYRSKVKQSECDHHGTR